MPGTLVRICPALPNRLPCFEGQNCPIQSILHQFRVRMNLPRLDGLWKSSYSPPRPQRRVRMNLPCPDGLCGPNYSPSRRKRRARMNLPCPDSLWSPSQFLPLVVSAVWHESAMLRQHAKVRPS
jgi:hypothetical protein